MCSLKSLEERLVGNFVMKESNTCAHCSILTALRVGQSDPISRCFVIRSTQKNIKYCLKKKKTEAESNQVSRFNFQFTENTENKGTR